MIVRAIRIFKHMGSNHIVHQSSHYLENGSTPSRKPRRLGCNIQNDSKKQGLSLPFFCGASNDVGFPNLQPQIVVILSLKPSKWARVLSSFFAFNPPN
jgi:hypothetical protein